MGNCVMYYTYSHSAPNGKVFYIGKGKGDRAYSFNDRSHDWKRAIKQNNGVSVKILAYWNTEKEAFEHEEFLIACFNDLSYALVNKTKGGKGFYGYKKTEEQNKHISKLLTGYKHKKITCPHCNTEGGETSMKRWHFDKCTGAKKFKARTTINGVRVWLGQYATKEEADKVIKDYKEKQLVTVPSGSTWVIV
jgi:hypothetical protein